MLIIPQGCLICVRAACALSQAGYHLFLENSLLTVPKITSLGLRSTEDNDIIRTHGLWQRYMLIDMDMGRQEGNFN